MTNSPSTHGIHSHSYTHNNHTTDPSHFVYIQHLCISNRDGVVRILVSVTLLDPLAKLGVDDLAGPSCRAIMSLHNKLAHDYFSLVILSGFRPLAMSSQDVYGIIDP